MHLHKSGKANARPEGAVHGMQEATQCCSVMFDNDHRRLAPALSLYGCNPTIAPIT